MGSYIRIIGGFVSYIGVIGNIGALAGLHFNLKRFPTPDGKLQVLMNKNTSNLDPSLEKDNFSIVQCLSD